MAYQYNPKQHDCLLSTRMEAFLFKKDEKLDTSGDCPICLQPLSIDDKTVCCGGYAKALKCNHVVHVSCQVDRNLDFSKCPICRQQIGEPILIKSVIDTKIRNVINSNTYRELIFDCLQGHKICTPEDIQNIGFYPTSLRGIIDRFMKTGNDIEKLTAVYNEIMHIYGNVC